MTHFSNILPLCLIYYVWVIFVNLKWFRSIFRILPVTSEGVFPHIFLPVFCCAEDRWRKDDRTVAAQNQENFLGALLSNRFSRLWELTERERQCCWPPVNETLLSSVNYWAIIFFPLSIRKNYNMVSLELCDLYIEILLNCCNRLILGQFNKISKISWLHQETKHKSTVFTSSLTFSDCTHVWAI